MMACTNFTTAMVNRFFLGFFEAAVTPGLSLLTGMWYTRAESPLRQTIWYSSVGWGGMIGSVSLILLCDHAFRLETDSFSSNSLS